MSRRRVAVVGAGGFAREVRWLIAEIAAAPDGEALEFAGYVLSDPDRVDEARRGRQGDCVLGDFGWLEAHRSEIDALALGIGDPGLRYAFGRDLAQRLPELDWPTLVHPSVRYDRESCVFGNGALLCAGTVATVNVKIGPFTLVNLACTLGHEAELGTACVLNPTVNISGGVVLGDRVLVGTGAQILQYLEIGDDARIGAGAVVTANVEPATTVVGVPARPLRTRPAEG